MLCKVAAMGKLSSSEYAIDRRLSRFTWMPGIAKLAPRPGDDVTDFAHRVGSSPRSSTLFSPFYCLTVRAMPLWHSARRSASGAPGSDANCGVEALVAMWSFSALWCARNRPRSIYSSL